MASIKPMNRREFLRRSAVVTVGITAGGAAARRRALGATPQGANDRINVAVMGIRNRGSRHIEGFAEVPNVRVTTLVDIDENLFANRVRFTEELHGAAPATAHDLRRVCEDPDIDAIAMATPNHWHALGTLWACQAGKHVYVEKPVSHNLWEGRKMVEAARKYDRIVQVGTQSRSSQNVRDAIEFLHQGGLGEIYMARGLCIKARPNIGHFPDGPADRGPTEDQLFGYFPEMVMYPVDEAYLENVHYDLWLGPAPQRPFNRNRFHYNWHWQWDYGNGDIGNTGPHEFDIARWGLQKEAHPIKIRSMGGYYVFDSDQETPNTQSALYEYSDGKVL
ncbi:MAG TPA: Gfo/Idh/MocA family oxidoreductase, partial [bacterium]|nr:Gfo/Idh/MocA family oxidoreductase [bacterium]